jgi:hypothetical protein
VSRRVFPNQQDAALEMGSALNLALLVCRAIAERQGFSRKGFTPGNGSLVDATVRLRPGPSTEN